MSRDDIRSAQIVLQSKGLYPGSIDGKSGPGTRLGLAAYFKIVFDEYRLGLKKMCTEVFREVDDRRRETPLLGKFKFGSVEWYIEPAFVLITKDSTQLACSLGKDLGLHSASYEVRGGLGSSISVDFANQCSEDENWRQTELRVQGQLVGADYPCRKFTAGVPLNSKKQFQIWHKY